MRSNVNIVIISMILIMAGCNENTKTNTAGSTLDTLPSSPAITQTDTFQSIWVYDDVSAIPVKHKTVTQDTLTPQKLIAHINHHHGHGKIIMELTKISGDTVFVTIKESTYLTQSTGTTGADAYMSTAVYTLTELKGIRYVDFNFTEGDHAQPGTYSRQYYIDRMKANAALNQ